MITPFGGGIDVAFINNTAYLLVTAINVDLPIPVNNGDIVGIYRKDQIGTGEYVEDTLG